MPASELGAQSAVAFEAAAALLRQNIEAAIFALALATLVVGLSIVLILWRLSRRVRAVDGLPAAFEALEAGHRSVIPALRDESASLRRELRDMQALGQQSLEGRLSAFTDGQSTQLTAMRAEANRGRDALEDALKRNADTFSQTLTTRLSEANVAIKDLADRLQKAQAESREAQTEGLNAMSAGILLLTESNERRLDAIRESLASNLAQLRQDNEAKLEQMRMTVDEKLHATLEARLGESFKSVSDRLEQVHRGLGEMQSLATGVGDLKRVLTNVKSRGGWGEVQLGALLCDMLTPDQYERNVKIRPESGEIVEFAVRLPGQRQGDDAPLYLPIDAKFPQEDYDRLLGAQESGQAEDVEKAGLALERAIRLQAKAICERYVHPPFSTDFAILYLPTEGLFAEVIRRPGLCAQIQTAHRVMLTGPTTLAALLTSLQMGFRTLAIEKRSSEVWQVLGAAKAEFRKYGEVWDKLGKQLDSAKRTVDEVSKRNRAVERRLRDIETIEAPKTGPDVVDLAFEDDNA